MPFTPGRSTAQVLDRSTPERLATWEYRVFTILSFRKAFVPAPLDAGRLHMLFRAVLGMKGPAPGLTWYPHLGENARISADRRVFSRYADESNGRPIQYGEREVCAVDDLNRALGWIMKEIQATDADYQAIIGKFNAWIARDETQMGLHVERQRAALDGTK